MHFVEVDGSLGEGGGQILRTAVAFSTILNKPVRVTRIRAGRDEPGLKRQHVSALRVLERAFGGELDGAVEGSSSVTFVPGNGSIGSLSFDMGTAASITLVLQAVVPAAAIRRSDLRLELRGGTDVPWSPTFDYVDRVVRPAFARIGVGFSVESTRRGYYPKGGGRVSATVRPCERVAPLDLAERPRIAEARLVSRCGSLPKRVAERQIDSASRVLESNGVRVVGREAAEEQSDSPGTSILVHLTDRDFFFGADAIGARGKPAEQVGREAAEKFLLEARSEACVDSNLADMVLPLLALADAPSKVRVPRVTEHLRSGLDLARQFTSCVWSSEQSGVGAVVFIDPQNEK